MAALATSRARVFIDGEAGTTGLQIRERLARLASTIEVVSIDPARRKDAAARAEVMQTVDAVVLCLPDEAAIEAVAIADGLGPRSPKIVDASTAHRVAPGWVYGFAELDAHQAGVIRGAARVANPGCYPTGAIALIRPLIDAQILASDTPITVNAVSGYSGGGRSMIEAYEAGRAPLFELYGLALDHKHIPELMAYGGLTRRPIFVPSVGNFAQGMLVSIPLHLEILHGKPAASDIEAALRAHYAPVSRVRVMPAQMRLEPQALNGGDDLELFVCSNPAHGQAVLIGRLDNLGKGAAGAAVQNLQLMLGLA